jgi:hypothetical protein
MLPPGLVLRHKDEVEVLDGVKWRHTRVDALPPPSPERVHLDCGDIGWVCVEGWPGRAGPVSIRREHVRLPFRCMACLTPVRPGANDPCRCATSPLRSATEKNE